MEIIDLVTVDEREAEEKPFRCSADPNCSKAFARYSDCQRHERIHKNERPFPCEYPGCGKSFIQRSALNVHNRTHTGERPHICEVETCRRAFADSSSLARHRRLHNGRRPYICAIDDCAKKFRCKASLTRHIKSVHVPGQAAKLGTGDQDDESDSSNQPSNPKRARLEAPTSFADTSHPAAAPTAQSGGAESSRVPPSPRGYRLSSPSIPTSSSRHAESSGPIGSTYVYTEGGSAPTRHPFQTATTDSGSGSAAVASFDPRLLAQGAGRASGDIGAFGTDELERELQRRLEEGGETGDVGQGRGWQ